MGYIGLIKLNKLRNNFVMDFYYMYNVHTMTPILLLPTAYHAPLDVYVELTRLFAENEVAHLPPDQPINVCVGKEWYRYPSSFFLPEDR